MKTIYNWFTATAVRSWFAHFLICLLVTYGAGRLLAPYLGGDTLLVMVWAATLAMAFYLYKEAGDELHYRAKGTFRKRHWADRVKAETDRGGDVLGPIAVCTSTWAAYLLTH